MRTLATIGRYEITGVVNGGYTVTATLANYLSASLPVGIDGNTPLNFRLDPSVARTTFGAGQYRIGLDMPIGRYYSDPSTGCQFQRLRGFGGSLADIIGTATRRDREQRRRLQGRARMRHLDARPLTGGEILRGRTRALRVISLSG